MSSAFARYTHIKREPRFTPASDSQFLASRIVHRALTFDTISYIRKRAS